jgi:hypothetical protein
MELNIKVIDLVCRSFIIPHQIPRFGSWPGSMTLIPSPQLIDGEDVSTNVGLTYRFVAAEVRL